MNCIRSSIILRRDAPAPLPRYLPVVVGPHNFPRLRLGDFFYAILCYDVEKEVSMMSIVRFPSDDAEMDTEEIDRVFDFIDERVADDAETRDVLIAMLVVIKMITSDNGLIEEIH